MLHKQSHQINRIIWNITHEFKKRKFNGHPVRRRLSHQKHLSHSFHDEYLVILLWPHRIWTEKQNFWKRRSHYSPFPFTTIRNVSHMRLGIPNSCSWCLRGAIVIFLFLLLFLRGLDSIIFIQVCFTRTTKRTNMSVPCHCYLLLQCTLTLSLSPFVACVPYDAVCLIVLNLFGAFAYVWYTPQRCVRM